ncbi:DgyrCDS1966 [Dimorphilus gyrociliatus]|uniref:DgyrCDS1966 n=1 Tax=Dimorphilus gyrociliatus TaxID=2664684 RepID=A0A7I8VAU5_9ANNE|nr:DgyrCDS1966 [Dimorphilus gyrociliatus]
MLPCKQLRKIVIRNCPIKIISIKLFINNKDLDVVTNDYRCNEGYGCYSQNLISNKKIQRKCDKDHLQIFIHESCKLDCRSSCLSNEVLLASNDPTKAVLDRKSTWYETRKNSCFQEDFITCLDKDFEGETRNLSPILTFKETDEIDNCKIVKIDTDLWKENELIRLDYIDCSRLIIIGSKRLKNSNFKEIRLSFKGRPSMTFKEIFSRVAFKRVIINNMDIDVLDFDWFKDWIFSRISKRSLILNNCNIHHIKDRLNNFLWHNVEFKRCSFKDSIITLPKSVIQLVYTDISNKKPIKIYENSIGRRTELLRISGEKNQLDFIERDAFKNAQSLTDLFLNLKVSKVKVSRYLKNITYWTSTFLLNLTIRVDYLGDTEAKSLIEYRKLKLINLINSDIVIVNSSWVPRIDALSIVFTNKWPRIIHLAIFEKRQSLRIEAFKGINDKEFRISVREKYTERDDKSQALAELAETVNFLVLIPGKFPPMSQQEQDITIKTSAGAVDLAFDNVRENILPSFDVKYTIIDTDCDPVVVLGKSAEKLLRGNTTAIIGPYCEKVTSFINAICSQLRIPLYTGFTKPDQYTDKKRFKVFVDKANRHYSEITKKISNEMNNHGIEIIDLVEYIPRPIKDSFYVQGGRIIVLCLSAGSFRNFVSSFKNSRHKARGYFFIVIQIAKQAVLDTFSWQRVKPEDDLLKDIYEYMFFVRLGNFQKRETYTKFNEMLKELSWKNYNYRYGEREKVEWATYLLYDSVMISAHAINRTSKLNLNYGDVYDIRRGLHNLEIPQGLSGYIYYNDASVRFQDYSVYHFQRGREELVFQFLAMNESLIEKTDIIWESGKVPADNFEKCDDNFEICPDGKRKSRMRILEINTHIYYF